MNNITGGDFPEAVEIQFSFNDNGLLGEELK